MSREEGGIVAKKGLIFGLIAFGAYLFVQAPTRMADLLKLGGTALSSGAETVASSIFAFLDALL